MTKIRIPTTTYRIQFNSGFTFKDAASIVDYLHQLGISDIYASPILQARSGSQHGYDVVDHGCLSADLGGAEGFAHLASALRSKDMSMLLDVVPNHACIAGSDNARWNDVLENGASSVYAAWFDINWNPPKPDLEGTVLLPILPDQYGRVLESGDLSIVYQEEGAFQVAYHDVLLPVSPRTWPGVLQPTVQRLRSEVGPDHTIVLELESIILALERLPPRTETDRARVRERRREKEIIKRRLRALVDSEPRVRDALHKSLFEINGRKGEPRTFERLEALLAEQGFRLAFWRVAADEINYRRFFDVNELAAIRVEHPAVFQSVHQVPLRLLREGIATGLRIDHIDGLRDPRKYLSDLRRAASVGSSGCYIVVEKILADGERLRPELGAHGTTGYEVLALLGGLFIEPTGGPMLRKVYERVLGQRERFADVAYETRKLVLRVALSSELTVLARKLDRISEQHHYSRDFTFRSLEAALEDLVACFPVYRTYARASDGIVSRDDAFLFNVAITEAKRRNPAVSSSLFDFILDVLLFQGPEGLGTVELAERRDFVEMLQQHTPPVMAKGVEDTAYYRYFPLASLCEVGSNPDHLEGVSPDRLHQALADRLATTPHGLSATATHDTKRGEDVRSRLHVLSEMPDRWEQAVQRWRDATTPYKTTINNLEAPDVGDEYLLYQTLMGAWPTGGPDASFVARIQRYMEKAIREAKIHTSWINPNPLYEQAVSNFIAAVLDPVRSAQLLGDLGDFAQQLARAGAWSSVSQVILKSTIPGVPDFYQGTELWDLNLVDPDNRCPVDFALRRRMLEELDNKAQTEKGTLELLRRFVQDPLDPRLKMWVTSRTLRLRRDEREVFERGHYTKVIPSGPRANQIMALARHLDERVVVAVVSRFFASMASPVADVWRGTTLTLPVEARRPFGFRDVLSGKCIELGPDGTLPLEQLFAHLPAALLVAL